MINKNTKRKFLTNSIKVFIKFVIWVQIIAPIICAFIGCICLYATRGSIEHFGLFYKENMLPFQCFLTFIVIIVIIAKKYSQHLRLSTKSRGKIGLQELGLLFLISFSFSFIDSFIDDVINLTNINASTFNVLDHSVLGVVSTCLLGPLAEEITFRGTIERKLLKWKRNPWIGILISALLFGIMHINPSQVESAFIFGVLLGWLYYKFGSVKPCLALHILNNFYCFVLDIYGLGNSSVQELCQKIHIPFLIIMLFSICLFLVCLFTISHKINRKHAKLSSLS